METPIERISAANSAAPRPDGEFVCYWMNAARRVRYNFALQRAIELSREFNRPLVVLEAIAADYRWASPRFHAFIADGMDANRLALASSPIRYYPYVEPAKNAGRGLVEALAARACVVVTDDFPCFELPRWTARVAASIRTKLERVDSNGLLPMRSVDRVFPTAHAFRRHLQRVLPQHFDAFPVAEPLKRLRLPRVGTELDAILKRWPEATEAQLSDRKFAQLPIDHTVGPVAGVTGGAAAAGQELDAFVDRSASYSEHRNQPSQVATSRLSPYLHFGHLSSHEIATELFELESWSPEELATTTNGSRSGWWGVSESVEAFLDQLVTWRELGFNMCALNPDYDSYESLPDWARTTLEEHESDPRQHVYSLEEFERATTHDPLWNAAQTELVTTGRMHNYLRMLWGKKILEWSATPREALHVMIELNNKFALDGRNPNSYSGIFWCLGRYDRAWGPVRPIFGKIRYMSSDNTARKIRVREYMSRFAPETAQGTLF